MLDAIRLESFGKPTVTLIQDRFERAARLHATSGGLPDLPLIIEPAPDDGTSIQRNVQDYVRNHMGFIVSALAAAPEVS